MKKITWNSPVILSFALISLIALGLNTLTNGTTNQLIFSVYGGSLLNPLFYLRLFTHVLGHADLSHYMNNMLLFLLVGPMLEEKYGSPRLLIVILVVALVTGIAHIIIAPNTMLLGASGVVFAFILLSAVTGSKEGIPLTFIIVAVLYIGTQIYQGVFNVDNVSQLTHIIGGIIGGIFGMTLRKSH